MDKRKLVKFGVSLVTGITVTGVVSNVIKNHVTISEDDKIGEIIVAVGTFLVTLWIADKCSEYTGELVDTIVGGLAELKTY